jgi:CTP:molybdopterin cytidylyltransferase MocA
VNVDPDRGPFSSLQCGLAHIAPGQPAFVLPIDVPAASPAVWAALAASLAAADAAVPTTPEDRGGHPVLLAPSFIACLRSLPPTAVDARLDMQLRRHAHVIRVPVADGRIRLNLNAPEDWGRLERGG